jgi:hypothetical protein
MGLHSTISPLGLSISGRVQFLFPLAIIDPRPKNPDEMRVPRNFESQFGFSLWFHVNHLFYIEKFRNTCVLRHNELLTICRFICDRPASSLSAPALKGDKARTSTPPRKDIENIRKKLLGVELAKNMTAEASEIKLGGHLDQ